MKRIALLENPVREYAWGSHTAIPELLGRPSPSARPQAELWMGAHPSAPSRVRLGGAAVPLCELIERDPEPVLGRRSCERFGPRLPFLFKVLAAEQPLSIQAHPDAEHALEGFARENALGIPLDAPERSYRDASHKPELICALTPFLGLRGFRPVAEIRERFGRLGTPGLAEARRALEAPDEGRALRDLLRCFLEMTPERREAAVREAVAVAAELAAEDETAAWAVRLHEAYPGDVGALAPAFLHLVRLEPGEAMYLPAGELHAYLHGVGLEVMANSDNVLRGGLTQKHVDVPELLRVLRFRPARIEKLRPRPDASGVGVYAAPAREFELARIEVRPGAPLELPSRGAEILLCTEGRVRVEASGGGVELARGASCLAPDAAGARRLAGEGVLYRASVPG